MQLLVSRKRKCAQRGHKLTISESDTEANKPRTAHSSRQFREGHTDLRVGEILRRARIRAGLSFADIESQIFIRATHLQTIEDGQFQNLPGRIYALGFIKSYAEFLGLDGDKVIALVKRQSARRIDAAKASASPPAPKNLESDQSVPSFKTLIIVSILLTFALTLFILKFAQRPHIPTVSPVPADLKEQVTLLTKPMPSRAINTITDKSLSDTQTTPIPSTGKSPALSAATTDETQNQVEVADIDTIDQSLGAHHPIILHANQNVWLEIKTMQGKIILSRVLATGEEYWVPIDQDELSLTLGNAGGLQIILNGENLPLLGRQGQVIRALPLTTEFLTTKLPTKNGTE